MRVIAILSMLLAVGCSNIRVTNPPRTATEQFLMSSAVTEAVAQIATDSLRDRLVYLDDRYFQIDPENVASIERDFAISEVRAKLLTSGARLVDERDRAQIIVEIRTGGIGIDRGDFLVGVPPLLLPGTGQSDSVAVSGATIISPEIAILKNIKQFGYASIAYVAYWRDSGEIVASSGPFIGTTYRTDWWYVGFGPNASGDISTAEDLE